MKNLKSISLILLLLTLFIKPTLAEKDTREACLKRGGVWENNRCIGPDRR
jgi:hypothetical protein